MDPKVHEWIQLATRWAHVVAGVLWVGTTAFFSWMDRAFGAAEKKQEGDVTGEIWMIHSGGYYHVEKRRFVPGQLPPQLHWFQWEAAIAWLTGTTLLGHVYYMNNYMVFADGIRERLSDRVSGDAIMWLGLAAGIAVLFLGWFLYDALECKGVLRGLGFFPLIVGAAYGLCQLFQGRAAYIHMGAMFGTIMAFNVWFRIIPGQKRIVEAVARAQQPDLAFAERAKRRSKHNTFLAVPLILMMISNHYPTASYGSRYNWLLLIGFIVVGWIARFLLNLGH